MIAAAGAVFLASLLGSPHCAGMCGGLVAFYAGTSEKGRALGHAAYNLGRLTSYAALGALAGSLGALVDVVGKLAGLQRAAAILAGAAMIAWGLSSLARLRGWSVPRLAASRAMGALAGRAARRLRDRPPLVRAAAVGLVTGLLPCGLLYAFIVSAAATGSAGAGAALMALFWTGTLPVMVGLGLAAQRLSGRLRRHLPAFTAVLLVVAGVFTVGMRAASPRLVLENVSPAVVGTQAQAPVPACHHGAAP